MLTLLLGTPPGSTLSFPRWGQCCCSGLLNINCPALCLSDPTPMWEPTKDFLMFQNQEKFRKHFTAGKTAGFVSYSHSLYSSFHSWKPCQRRSYMTAAFSTMQKLGRWQGGLPWSECQKPGNQPFFLLHISLGPAPLHPSPLPFPAGRHPAYLCLSRPLACLDTARKCAKRAGGHWIKSHQSSHPVWETRLCRAEHTRSRGANPARSSGPVARLRQLSPGALGLSRTHTQPHNSRLASCLYRGWWK